MAIRWTSARDIWAFGCVLYEMLTGRQAFPGNTISDSIASILTKEPDWTALPPATPTLLRRLLRRCLVKNARERLHDMSDVRLTLPTPSSHRLMRLPICRRLWLLCRAGGSPSRWSWRWSPAVR